MSQLELENSNITIHSISRRQNSGAGSQGTSAATTSAPSQSAAMTSAPSQSSATTTHLAQPSPSLPNLASDSHGQEPEVAIVSSVTTTEPTTSESQSRHDNILAGEANTLLTTTSPPEDEVQMTLSRSVSPTLISPAPSAPPSRCVSPVEERFADDALQGPTVGNDADTISTTAPALAPTSLSVIAEPTFTTSGIPDHIVPSARRSTRSVKKTSKLILSEENRRGKKRGAEVLVDGGSVVNQAPVKRGRAGKKGKKCL